MKVIDIDFVVYDVNDMQKALSFYQDTLGLTVEMNVEGKWVEFSVGLKTLALLGPGRAEPVEAGYKGGAKVAFAVSDINQMVETLREKGIDVQQPFETPVCHMADFRSVWQSTHTPSKKGRDTRLDGTPNT